MKSLSLFITLIAITITSGSTSFFASHNNQVQGQTTTAVPYMPCSSLIYHSNCDKNSSCMQFNTACVTDCGNAPSTSVCTSWSHCELASDGQRCNPKCSTLTNVEVCFGSEGCIWYNGKCDVECNSHKNQATCIADAKCWFDTSSSSSKSSCRVNCALASDAVQCAYFLGDNECAWDETMKVCARSCSEFSASTCNSQSGCYYSTSMQTCITNCAKFDSVRCGAESFCMWSNGACSVRCPFRSNQSDCTASPVCQYVNGFCAVGTCSLIQGAASCMSESQSCQWDARSSKCTASCWMSNSATTCPAAPYCNYSAGTNSCNEISCSFASVEGDCVAKSGCSWVGSMCVTKCEKFDSHQCELNPNYCKMSQDVCASQCFAFSSQGSCVAAGENCAWSTSQSKCYQKCSRLINRVGDCKNSASGCTFRNVTIAQTCTPTCSLATTSADCMSPFFQDMSGCFWDVLTSTCKVTCEFAAIGGACTAPCTISAAFSWCALEAAGPATTAAPVGIPRIQFTISAAANATGNVTAANFTAKLAAALGIPASTITTTITASGTVQVEFTSGTNANTQATAALAIAPSSIGASAAASLAPATTTAAPSAAATANLGLIIGCAVGGILLLIIILVVVKKVSSSGSGTEHQDARRGGDQPMLQVSHQVSHQAPHQGQSHQCEDML